MIAFIQQEAAEKVEEIEAKAEEEFNIEKSRLVSQQRVKIIDYYDKKEKQIELQRKIQHSNLANGSRLSILKARDDYVQSLKEEARKQLVLLTGDRTKYQTILNHLICQGLFLLMEKQVTIRCRKNDVDLVQQLIPQAMDKYKHDLKQKEIQVHLDDKNFLPDDSFVLSLSLSFCIHRLTVCRVLGRVASNSMPWQGRSKYPTPSKLDSR